MSKLNITGTIAFAIFCLGAIAGGVGASGIFLLAGMMRLL